MTPGVWETPAAPLASITALPLVPLDVEPPTEIPVPEVPEPLGSVTLPPVEELPDAPVLAPPVEAPPLELPPVLELPVPELPLDPELPELPPLLCARSAPFSMARHVIISAYFFISVLCSVCVKSLPKHDLARHSPMTQRSQSKAAPISLHMNDLVLLPQITEARSREIKKPLLRFTEEGLCKVQLWDYCGGTLFVAP
ncbi:MAG: hypothetical protein JWM68_2247 [Verrucomicrobiales bacterium]|nr:hypothetical protein [Verrucomicrobiales bacterium]